MKIQKIAKLCKKRGVIRIVTRIMPGKEQQLIGDGCALYFTGALPQLDEASVLATLDIPEKKRKLFDIQEENASIMDVSLMDNLESDKMIAREEIITLGSGGDSYVILFTSQGVRLLNVAYLDPMNDASEPVTLWERTDRRDRLRIIAKSGLFLAAILEPTPLPDDVADALGEVLAAYHQYREDPETGEIEED